MSPQVQGTPQDEHAIRAATTDFVKAWNRNDIVALAACFAPDGDVINPTGRVARGRGEVEKLLHDEQNGLFKGTQISMTQTHLHFVKPDLVITDYEFEVTRIRGVGGKEVTLKGLQTVLLRKDGDQWLVVAARPMIPTPLPGTHR